MENEQQMLTRSKTHSATKFYSEPPRNRRTKLTDSSRLSINSEPSKSDSTESSVITSPASSISEHLNLAWTDSSCASSQYLVNEPQNVKLTADSSCATSQVTSISESEVCRDNFELNNAKEKTDSFYICDQLNQSIIEIDPQSEKRKKPDIQSPEQDRLQAKKFEIALTKSMHFKQPEYKHPEYSNSILENILNGKCQFYSKDGGY